MGSIQCNVKANPSIGLRLIASGAMNTKFMSAYVVPNVLYTNVLTEILGHAEPNESEICKCILDGDKLLGRLFISTEMGTRPSVGTEVGKKKRMAGEPMTKNSN